MNSFVVAFFCLVAAASASHVALWGGHGHNPAAHIASGSVSVGAHGAVIAGPAGSVHTDNGLHGHGAGVNVAGPAGDVRTHAGHVTLSGPGNGHDGGWGHGGHGGWGHHGGVVAVAPVAVGYGGWGGHGGWGIGHGIGHGISHGIGHGVGHGLGHAVIGHGLIGHGHHGW